MTLTRRTPKSHPAVVDSTNNDRKLSSSIRGVESSSLDSGVPLGNDDDEQQQQQQQQNCQCNTIINDNSQTKET